MNLATQVPKEWLPLIAKRAGESRPPLKPNTWISDIVAARTTNPAPVPFVPRSTAHKKQARVIGFASGRTEKAVNRRVAFAKTTISHWTACVIGEALGMPYVASVTLKDDDTHAINAERAEAARVMGLPQPVPLVKAPKPPKPVPPLSLAALRSRVATLEERIAVLERAGKAEPVHVPAPVYGPPPAPSLRDLGVPHIPDDEPMGPDSFPGTDEGSHLMAQTDFGKLRRNDT